LKQQKIVVDFAGKSKNFKLWNISYSSTTDLKFILKVKPRSTRKINIWKGLYRKIAYRHT
jgi:hypothetical protein